jgi:hypothetical protein
MEEVLFYTIVAVIVLLILMKLTSDKVVYRFYMPGCRYCIDSQSEWNKFVVMSLVSPHRTSELNMKDPSNGQLVSTFGVQGAPTVVKVHKGKYEIYQGDRTAQSYMDWMNQ